MLMILTMSERFYESPEGVAYMRRVMLDNPNAQSAEAFARQAEPPGATTFATGSPRSRCRCT